MDGGCGVGGSKIGILLHSQNWIKFHHTAKLAFFATNNIAEYEAVIIALKIVAEIDIQESIIFSDSQLVINQYQGQFKVQDSNLIKYEDKE